MLYQLSYASPNHNKTCSGNLKLHRTTHRHTPALSVLRHKN
jgi:hypothetical protein